MDEQIAICYKFYNKKGQRLASFCRFIDETHAEILLIPCSKKDQFSKKHALDLYKQWLEGMAIPSAQVIAVTIVPEERTLKTLFRYAEENLFTYRLKELQVFEVFELKPIKNA